MTDFKDFGLRPELEQAVAAMGYSQPTEIQEKAIPQILDGTRDFIGLAQTGTGKTAAYGLPALHLVDLAAREIQFLILCPTRELCVQVAGEIGKMSAYMEGLSLACIYGGVGYDKQIRELRRNPAIVVATPGRLIDLLNKGNINLEGLKCLILDEADKMLEMGFWEDVETIAEASSKDKRIWLFSATMADPIRKMANRMMENPAEATIGLKNTTAKNIKHYYYTVSHHNRFAALQRIIDAYPGMFAIIFTRTKAEAQEVAEGLTRAKYNADCLHGDMPQHMRDRTMKMFRERTLQLLVATDVAARGLDIDDLTHVINYGAPEEMDSYVHRAGRTARAGKYGECLTLLNSRDRQKFLDLARHIKLDIQQGSIPSGTEIVQRQMLNVLENLRTVPEVPSGFTDMVQAFESELASLDKEEIIRRFCSWSLQRFIEQYAGAEDLNPSFGVREGREGVERESSGTSMYLNLGSKDGFMSKMDLIDFLVEHAGVKPKAINRMRLRDTHATFETEPAMVNQLVEAINGGEFEGRKVVLRVDRPAPDGPRTGGGGRSGDRNGFRSTRGGGEGRGFGGGDRGGDRGADRGPRREYGNREGGGSGGYRKKSYSKG